MKRKVFTIMAFLERAEHHLKF